VMLREQETSTTGIDALLLLRGSSTSTAIDTSSVKFPFFIMTCY
jgi:hypothetical protein